MSKEKEKKNIALRLTNVSLSYRIIQPYSIKRNLLKLKGVKSDYFQALKNVNFELEEGKILGVIGSNGSGKSTLLKAIAGIFSPDEGTIELFNNTVSLQAIGVGFKSRLTGYENIYISGLLLGFSKSQIESKIDEIIEFSELGDFIYKPISTYSSGMVSKLAFSITAIFEADIILIDEILSVGDTSFREKSFNKIKEIIFDQTKTVIIVSHNMGQLKEVCDEVLWLEGGEVKDIGEPNKVISEYIAYISPKKK